MNPKSDEYYMGLALKWAARAAELDEVPVGAVVVAPDGSVLAHGYNMRENWQTPLGHAELIAIHKAAKKLGQWRLIECTLYVTLEPCAMCAGAIVHGRLGRLVYGATDPKAGATESLYQICSDARLNHRLPMRSGVLGAECSEILKSFFRRRRLEKKGRSVPVV